MENLQGGTLALEHYYHLDERIRSFGLVTLYGATQDPFDHAVRVTVYDGLLEAGAAPDVAERISRSAREASKLPGSELLSVLDFGEIEQGVPFVIEETVDGPSLAEVMESTDVFAPGRVADLIEQLAELLQTAHDHQICHGNLQPDWIVVPGEDPDFGEARLMHFGLGPSMRELVAMSQAVLTTDLVEAFPPESFDVAARDEEEGELELETDDEADEPTPTPHLTPAADQWALASLAYRMLVGVHPFFDDPVDASEGILRIKTEDPPRLRKMGVEPEISEVVDRALQHDPGDRFDSIADFAAAFREAVDGPAEAAGEPTDRPASTSTPAGSDDEDNEPVADLETTAGPGDDLDRRPAADGAEPTRPRPSGYLLTAALAALILTNLGWFFVTMDDEPDGEDQTETETAQRETGEALPDGLQIRTRPEPAELWIRDPDQGTEESMGSTPFALTDSMLQQSELTLGLRHEDYVDQTLAIEETDTGRDLIVEMRETPEEQ